MYLDGLKSSHKHWTMTILPSLLYPKPGWWRPSPAFIRRLGTKPIFSLVDEKPPTPSRLFHFGPDSRLATGQLYLACKQPVEREGVHYGPMTIRLTNQGWVRAHEGGLVLCPYFDASSQTLRFRKADGEEIPEQRSMPELLQHRGARPLLHLGHAEGLIAKVPGEILLVTILSLLSCNGVSSGILTSCNPLIDRAITSLDFERALEGGYHVRVWKTRVQSLSNRFQPCFRFTDAPQLARVKWYVPSGDHREYIDCFPYIDADGQLRFWDLALKSDVRMRIRLSHKKLAAMGLQPPKRGLAVVHALDPRRVYFTMPQLFEQARRMGYWKDIRIPTCADQVCCVLISSCEVEIADEHSGIPLQKEVEVPPSH